MSYYDTEYSSSAQPIEISHDAYDSTNGLDSSFESSLHDQNYSFAQPAADPYPQTYAYSGWGGADFELREEPLDGISMSLPAHFTGETDFDWHRQAEDFRRPQQEESERMHGEGYEQRSLKDGYDLQEVQRNRVEQEQDIFHQSPLMVGSAHVDPVDQFDLDDMNDQFSRSRLDGGLETGKEDDGYSTPVGAMGHMELPEMDDYHAREAQDGFQAQDDERRSPLDL